MKLLVEIGCEELPHRYVSLGRDKLVVALDSSLRECGLEPSSKAGYATPRRLAALLDIPQSSQASQSQKRGPSITVAYDASGEPTKALQGFARSAGVAVESLLEQDGYVVASILTSAQGAAQLLPNAIVAALRNVQFDKTMRWEQSGARFPRPVRWIVALLDSEIVDLEVWGLGATSVSQGLRGEAPVELSHAEHYVDALRSANVIVDRQERRQRVVQIVSQVASESQIAIDASSDLIDEVTDLCEYPEAAIGGFDADLLELPAAVLTTAMQHHQRYFPLRAPDGTLAPKFAVVINGPREVTDVIIAGNERVLRARLLDARFFVNEDLRMPLIERDLSSLVFNAALGSMQDKTQRVIDLSEAVSELVSDAEPQIVRRAAAIAKKDLACSIVFEFPELAATAGAEYHVRQAPPGDLDAAKVALSVAGHTAVGETISPDAVALGLADRIDTLVGFLGVDLAPTGSEDPHALRRAAGEVVQLVISRKVKCDLADLAVKAVELYKGQGFLLADNTIGLFTSLLTARLWASVSSEFQRPLFEAAVAATDLNPLQIVSRCEALSQAAKSDQLHEIVAAAQRPTNLISLQTHSTIDSLQSFSFPHPAEVALLQAATAAFEPVLAIDRSPREALNALQSLQHPIAEFFDRDSGVLVMDEDIERREARLALLSVVASLFIRVADFSKIPAS